MLDEEGTAAGVFRPRRAAVGVGEHLREPLGPPIGRVAAHGQSERPQLRRARKTRTRRAEHRLRREPRHIVGLVGGHQTCPVVGMPGTAGRAAGAPAGSAAGTGLVRGIHHHARRRKGRGKIGDQSELFVGGTSLASRAVARARSAAGLAGVRRAHEIGLLLLDGRQIRHLAAHRDGPAPNLLAIVVPEAPLFGLLPRLFGAQILSGLLLGQRGKVVVLVGRRSSSEEWWWTCWDEILAQFCRRFLPGKNPLRGRRMLGRRRTFHRSSEKSKSHDRGNAARNRLVLCSLIYQNPLVSHLAQTVRPPKFTCFQRGRPLECSSRRGRRGAPALLGLESSRRRAPARLSRAACGTTTSR